MNILWYTQTQTGGILLNSLFFSICLIPKPHSPINYLQVILKRSYFIYDVTFES